MILYAGILYDEANFIKTKKTRRFWQVLQIKFFLNIKERIFCKLKKD
jgi:hypothetical protein